MMNPSPPAPTEEDTTAASIQQSPRDMAKTVVDEVISTVVKSPQLSPRDDSPDEAPPLDIGEGGDESDFIESQDLSIMSESVPSSPPGAEVNEEDISTIKSPRSNPVPEPEELLSPVPTSLLATAQALTPAPAPAQVPAYTPTTTPAPTTLVPNFITPAAQKLINDAESRASRANARFAAVDLELQQLKEKYAKLKAEETAEHLEVRHFLKSTGNAHISIRNVFAAYNSLRSAQLEKVGMERDILKRDVIENEAKTKELASIDAFLSDISKDMSDERLSEVSIDVSLVSRKL